MLPSIWTASQLILSLVSSPSRSPFCSVLSSFLCSDLSCISTALPFGSFFPLSFHSWSVFLCQYNPFFALLCIYYCFHGFQLPLCWYFSWISFAFSSSLSLSHAVMWSLPLFAPSNLSFLWFPELYMFTASLYFTLVVLSCLLFRRRSTTSSFILRPSADLSVLSLVFSSGGVSWEGQQIYPPKKGTNVSRGGVCRSTTNSTVHKNAC